MTVILTEEEKNFVHKRGLKVYNDAFIAKHIAPMMSDISYMFTNIEGAKNGIDDNLKIALDEQYLKGTIDRPFKTLYVGDGTSSTYQPAVVSRYILQKQYDAKLGINDPGEGEGFAGITITKDGIQENGLYLSKSRIVSATDNTTNIGYPTNVFKDIWIGIRNIDSSNGYSRLPNGMIMQWGSKTIPITASPNAQADFAFPIAFPNACIHCSADNGKSSNAWYDLLMSAVALDKTSVRLMCKNVTGSNLLGTLTCTYFAIGF